MAKIFNRSDKSFKTTYFPQIFLKMTIAKPNKQMYMKLTKRTPKNSQNDNQKNKQTNMES